ncbi:hypothetical protein IMZ48_17650 [Candidatus Bathyarchaeota archaeon]|nr:hypothetical protein [Candidatus Bathyarchaeota archaeon]
MGARRGVIRIPSRALRSSNALETTVEVNRAPAVIRLPDHLAQIGRDLAERRILLFDIAR